MGLDKFRSTYVGGWTVWGRALGALALFLFGPLVLIGTPLRGLAINWAITWLLLLLLLLWAIGMSFLIGVVLSQPPEMLGWVERRLRFWVARFSADPALLWLQWARQAFRPEMAHCCLDQAILNGNAEGMFHQGLVYLEGGFGGDGQSAAMIWLRRAAEKGHAEAAFRLAECLRTRAGRVLAEDREAETWYQRSASARFGPAAEWLAHAYDTGDGVMPDETKARYWADAARRLLPFPELSRSVLRHDAAPEDPLVRLFGGMGQGLEKAVGRLVTHRYGRWALLLGSSLLAVLALFVIGAFFWAGSSSLYHLPLLMVLPPTLMLAWQAYQLRKDRPRSGRDRLMEAAEAGDPQACYELGLAYRTGSPARPRDDLSAAVWFRKAAEAGHPLAMVALSDAFLGGHGLPRDPREAARWAKEARRESSSGMG